MSWNPRWRSQAQCGSFIRNYVLVDAFRYYSYRQTGLHRFLNHYGITVGERVIDAFFNGPRLALRGRTGEPRYAKRGDWLVWHPDTKTMEIYDPETFNRVFSPTSAEAGTWQQAEPEKGLTQDTPVA